MRGQAAIAHGSEIGLLACTADDGLPVSALGDIIVPVPQPMTVPNIAFNLLSVVLTTVNAVEAVRTRFAWPAHPRLDRRYESASAKMTRLWADAVNAE